MSSKNAYRLINPYIEGSIDTLVRSSNSFNAGKKIYNLLSNYFTNHVEDFYMTIQNLETKDLTHFRVNESRNKGNEVDFNLIRLENNFSDNLEKKLVESVEGLEKQSGGKHRDKDDTTETTTTTDSDYYGLKVPVYPITKFIYFYLPYYKLDLVGISPLDTQRVFMPMFSLPINPTLEVRFDVYKYF